MPGAVIEPLYLSDPFEGSIADTPADQQIIAGAIAGAVEQFLVDGPGRSATPGTGGSCADSERFVDACPVAALLKADGTP